MRPDTRVRRFTLRRGRLHKPKPPPRPPCPLSDQEVIILGAYNAMKDRGVVHTEEWDHRMARLQERYDRWLTT